MPIAPYYYNPAAVQHTVQTLHADVCIYGGTPAGIAAAEEVHRLGKTSIVLEPSGHLGGMSASGLGATDLGNKAAIGGIALEFYKRIGAKYGTSLRANFEPHVAEAVFNEMAAESAIVFKRQFIKSVAKTGRRIEAITLESGLTVRAEMFIDASYEGDLMAKSGVSYTIGREDNAKYRETIDGVQISKGHQFLLAVDPYVTEGDPSSGLLPGINATDPGPAGTGDKRVQAYGFRLCLTKQPENRIPIEKPAGYDAAQYILLSRYLAKGLPESDLFRLFNPLPNGKADKNNAGAISTDFIGGADAYPDAGYAAREAIFQRHVTYEQGLMWFLGNDASVPAQIREKWAEWGLCKDEFQETGGWPYSLYIREARRMVSDVVMTEHNCRGDESVSDSVGLASYTMDSHNCERIVRDGRVLNEGNVEVRVRQPYPISYRSIVPRASECANLLAPICLSATHIAYGSIRMEPVFMILGQSAGAAAVLSEEQGLPLQSLPYCILSNRLIADGQVLSWGQ
ncbi:MAG: FAD-dependent oxidoreductase [Capsulimonadaceae bacterium]|nr:FAD-dependent oxidoreductase [Capsulimonadaceae bacterium]